MASPFANYPVPERTFLPANPAARATSTPARGTGAKRGRKPKNASFVTESTRTSPQTSPTTSTPTALQWTAVQSNAPSPNTVPFANPVAGPSGANADGDPIAALSSEAGGVVNIPGIVVAPSAASGEASVPGPAGPHGADEDVEIDDELLPAMADDDYSAQLSWQSQSKDNLKVLMDNFSPAHHERFEAYRRHALPKSAVRKVIQQTLGQQVSQPVAQIVAGFSKVFVGEMMEKAHAVQQRRGETGPLSPDHLREAYRLYQEETGRVGAARPLRSKRIFMK